MRSRRAKSCLKVERNSLIWDKVCTVRVEWSSSLMRERDEKRNLPVNRESTTVERLAAQRLEITRRARWETLSCRLQVKKRAWVLNAALSSDVWTMCYYLKDNAKMFAICALVDVFLNRTIKQELLELLWLVNCMLTPHRSSKTGYFSSRCHIDEIQIRVFDFGCSNFAP